MSEAYENTREGPTRPRTNLLCLFCVAGILGPLLGCIVPAGSWSTVPDPPPVQPVQTDPSPEPDVPMTPSLWETGAVIALQADTGMWWSRCMNCQRAKGDRFQNTITLHQSSPDAPYSQFEVIAFEGGKVALRADNGGYVARCPNCIWDGTETDFLALHCQTPQLPFCQLEPLSLGNGKWALRSDNGLFVARCKNCSPGAKYPDTVTIHVADPAVPFAQWTVVRIR